MKNLNPESLEFFLQELMQFVDLRYKGFLLLDSSREVIYANERLYELFQLSDDSMEPLTLQVDRAFQTYGIERDTESFYDRSHHQVNIRHQSLRYGDSSLSAWIFEVIGTESIRNRIQENIVQYSLDGIHAVDRNGCIIIYNDAQGKIDKYEPREVLGKHITEVYALNEETSLLLNVLKTQQPVESVRQNYYTQKGTYVDCVASVVPLFYHGKIFGSAAIVRNYNAILNLNMETKGTKKSQSADAKSVKKLTRYTFDNIISMNEGMEKCIRTARQAAESDSNVLIIGETGTGKEMFAQSIHAASPRRDKPFMAINCAAIPESLLESLLFGTTKGAFTGAMDKAGIFEEARGGTLFLDEINSMSKNLQSKLLRVLEERTVTRLGSNQVIRVNVRIISSCNENPISAVKQNVIREDLFYRLAVLYIVIPSLWKRRDDIPVLTKHFITYFNETLGKKVLDVDNTVKEFFQIYSWPGNVRQLRHVIESSMNEVGEEELYIGMQHLPKYIFGDKAVFGERPMHMELIGRQQLDYKEETFGLIEKMKEEEKRKVIEALKEHNGNMTKAAEQLGMSRQKLYYRLKKYGIK